MKHNKMFAPLRLVINPKNFNIFETVEKLKDLSSDDLIAFSNDLEKIKHFLDAVHKRAIKK